MKAAAQSLTGHAVHELVAFTGALLTINVAAKLILLNSPILASLGDSLKQDWAGSMAFVVPGLLCFWWFTQRLLSLRVSDFRLPAIFVALSFLGAAILPDLQDFSWDGQWYHLHRVVFFYQPDRLINPELAAHSLPAITYPMIIDNLRGLIVALVSRERVFAGISVNLAILVVGAVFWIRYCTFLPRWLRPVAALSAVAMSQLFTYYIDGFLAIYASMSLLVVLLLMRDLATSLVAHDRRQVDGFDASVVSGLWAGVVISGLAIFLFLAEGKFSFALYFIMILVPVLAAVLVVIRAGESSILSSQSVTVLAAFRDHHLRCRRLLIGFAGSFLLLFNPYSLIVKELILRSSDTPFSLPVLKRLSSFTFGEQFSPGLLSTAPLGRFFVANFLSFIPSNKGQPEQMVDLSLARTAWRSWMIIDARESGFGVAACLIFWLALVVSVYILIRFFRKPIIVLSLEAGRPALMVNGVSFLLTILSLTFIVQVGISSVYGLGWWARINPIPYTVASLVVLLAMVESLSAAAAFIWLTRIAVGIMVLNFVMPAFLALRYMAGKGPSDFRIDSLPVVARAMASGDAMLALIADADPLASTTTDPHAPGLIQSVSQAPWPGLSAWGEVGGIAPCPCPKPLFPQPIST